MKRTLVRFSTSVYVEWGQERMLKEEANEQHEAPSASMPATQDTSELAMPSVESPSSNSNATMALEVEGATPTGESGGSATTATSCDIPRRIRASRGQGRIAVIPNTDSQRACCELCRGTPNSECRSWYRREWSQNSRCFLNSLAE